MTRHATSLPAAAHIGGVHLQIHNLERSLNFYRDYLGFRLIRRDDGRAALSPDGGLPWRILLTQRMHAQPKPRDTTGLYHVALKYPSRLELARAFKRLADLRWGFHGFSDHLVSEALYLSDPDGNGLELYVDRPSSEWIVKSGQIEMATVPLDLDNLLSELRTGDRPWSGAHPEIAIGHIHLHVADLERAERFYHGILGFDISQRSYPGALFLAAGGYHHHIGVNVWAGDSAAPPPPDAVGLLSFRIAVQESGTIEMLKVRLTAERLEWKEYTDDDGATIVSLHDEDGVTVELAVR